MPKVGRSDGLEARLQAVECLLLALVDALPQGTLPVVGAYYASAVERVRSQKKGVASLEAFEEYAKRLEAAIGQGMQ